MICVSGENFRLECPVLIDLGECLHEIAGDGCAADILETAFREHSVQCVPEFVEGCADLVDGQEADRISRLGEIAYVYHDRAYIIAGGIHILLPEVGHPRSAPLGAAGKIIRHEPAEKRAVCIGDLEGLHLRMIYRNICRFYLYAVETLGGLEYSGAHIVKLEILAYL